MYIGPDHQCEGWPDPETYKPLTLQDALDARARQSRRPSRNNNRNVVTSTVPFESEFNNVYNAGTTAARENNTMYNGNKAERSLSAPPTSHIREINAVLPSSSIPFALGSGSDTSDENRVSVAPLTVDHLKWNANVFGNNEFPMRIECLLDNGAHLILIRPETVADLALPICKLSEPFSITVAIRSEKVVSTFHNYVHLQLCSVNNEWSSKTVHALITPDLCTNILLGLPFLAHNNIVVDHASRTVIDKESGFNLLDDNCLMPRRTVTKMVPPKVKVKRILDNRKKTGLSGNMIYHGYVIR